MNETRTTAEHAMTDEARIQAARDVPKLHEIEDRLIFLTGLSETIYLAFGNMHIEKEGANISWALRAMAVFAEQLAEDISAHTL